MFCTSAFVRNAVFTHLKFKNVALKTCFYPAVQCWNKQRLPPAAKTIISYFHDANILLVLHAETSSMYALSEGEGDGEVN